MYLLRAYFENAHENGAGELCLKKDGNEIAKWTLLSDEESSQELLRLIAAACGGASLLPHMPFAWRQLFRNPEHPLQVELILALHPPYEASLHRAGLLGSGIRMDGPGLVRRLKRKEYRFLSPEMSTFRAKTGMGDSWLFLLGYGPEQKHHDGTDDFDFTDPHFRINRFHSLFLERAPLTDPVEFLTRLHYRGVRHKRLPPLHAMDRLARLLKAHLAIDTDSWMDKPCDFRQQWTVLTPWQQRAALPVLDTTRHLLDAYPKHTKPLDLPGLVLFERPKQIFMG
jgi:hypothetical protein